MENPAHSDFLLLRNMLVRTHMQDLKDVTREIHYENYRAQCIQNMTRMVVLERKRRWVEAGCTTPQTNIKKNVKKTPLSTVRSDIFVISLCVWVWS